MIFLNDDIIKEIILLLDLNTIKNFSSVNRHTYNLCGNNDIWINKFKQDKLSIITSGNNKVKNWVKEYNNIKVATEKLHELNERVIKDNSSLIIVYMDFSYDDNITELLEPSFQKQISSGMKLIDVCNYTNEAIYIDITNSNKNINDIKKFSYSVRYKFFNFYAYADAEKEATENKDDDKDGDENDDENDYGSENNDDYDEDDDYENDDENNDKDDDENDEDNYSDDDGYYVKCDDYEFHRDEGTDLLHCELISTKNIVDKLILDIFYYYPTNNFTYHISQQ